MAEHPDYLRRLHKDAYCGIAYVHWTHTVDWRKTGWLTAEFHIQFREVLTHTAFLYDLDIPCYCLMPDHFHIMMIGNHPHGSDQRKATRWMRKQLNQILSKTKGDFMLQKQAHDNVLRAKDRERDAFPNACNYVRNNPRRAKLIPDDADGAAWKFQGCIVPERPQLTWSDATNTEFWETFWKVHYLKIDRNSAQEA